MRGIITDSLIASSLLRQLILADPDRNFEAQLHRLKLLNSGFKS